MLLPPRRSSRSPMTWISRLSCAGSPSRLLLPPGMHPPGFLGPGGFSLGKDPRGAANALWGGGLAAESRLEAQRNGQDRTESQRNAMLCGQIGVPWAILRRPAKCRYFGQGAAGRRTVDMDRRNAAPSERTLRRRPLQGSRAGELTAERPHSVRWQLSDFYGEEPPPVADGQPDWRKPSQRITPNGKGSPGMLMHPRAAPTIAWVSPGVTT
jgi:hypothetical protein